MQKILSLGSKQFLSGIGVSPYYEEAGIFDVAQGIDFWRNPGLISTGFTTTDITGTSTQIPRWILNYPKRAMTYVLGVGSGTLDSPAGRGWIHQFEMDTDAISDTHSKSMSTIRGAIIHKNRLLYVQGNAVGNTNLDVSGTIRLNSTYSDTWQANTWDYVGIHPMLLGPDNNVYVGDGNHLDRISIGATSSYTADALTNPLPAGMVITCGTHDGNYLVFGASSRPSDLTNVSYADAASEIYFWDTWSPSFNKKWTLPESPIRKIRAFEGGVHVFSGDNEYVCSYDSSPQLFMGNNNISNLSLKPDMESNSVDIWNGQLMWGESGSVNLWEFGSYNKKLSPILSNPYYMPTSANIASIKGITKNKIYVGTTNNKLYALKTGNRSGTATTVLIDLKETYKIEGIKVVTKALTSGDSLDVQIQNEAGSNIIENKFSFSNEGAKTSKFIKTQRGVNPITDQIIIDLDLTGNVRIKRIDLFGTPVEQTYAE